MFRPMTDAGKVLRRRKYEAQLKAERLDRIRNPSKYRPE